MSRSQEFQNGTATTPDPDAWMTEGGVRGALNREKHLFTDLPGAYLGMAKGLWHSSENLSQYVAHDLFPNDPAFKDPYAGQDPKTPWYLRQETLDAANVGSIFAPEIGRGVGVGAEAAAKLAVKGATKAAPAVAAGSMLIGAATPAAAVEARAAVPGVVRVMETRASAYAPDAASKLLRAERPVGESTVKTGVDVEAPAPKTDVKTPEITEIKAPDSARAVHPQIKEQRSEWENVAEKSIPESKPVKEEPNTLKEETPTRVNKDLPSVDISGNVPGAYANIPKVY